MPDRQGMKTSVNTRSMLFCRFSRYRHACEPFSAGITKMEGDEIAVKTLKQLKLPFLNGDDR
jgi:hypothetical protein